MLKPYSDFKLIMAIIQCVLFTIQPVHDKTNKMTCTPSEDAEQPGHPPSLISLCCPHKESLDPWLFLEHTVKTDQTVQMPRLI